MGANLSCEAPNISAFCCGREKESLEQLSREAEEWNSFIPLSGANVEHHKQCEHSNTLSSSDDEVKSQIKAVVNDGAECCKQSPVQCSSDSELKDQINAIVQAHAKSLKQQRLSDVNTPGTDPGELASPSPAKSLSDSELAYFASLALSAAKERNTPAKSPSPSYVHWSAYEDDIAPCRLSFADDDAVAVEDQMYEQQFNTATWCSPTILFEPGAALPCIVQLDEESTDVPKVQTCPFDVNDVPSPTRNRARAMMRSVLAEDEVQQTSAESSAEEAQEKAAEEEEEEAARLREIEEAKARRRAEEAARLREIGAAELAAMDERCVNTFLEAVKVYAWRERVRTPIKGSNLYTKHIRPCRPAGTSVDVKDSQFRCLGNFLQFLEEEGLLRLKPGLTDPVVTEINFNACRKYKYVSRPQIQYQ